MFMYVYNIYIIYIIYNLLYLLKSQTDPFNVLCVCSEQGSLMPWMTTLDPQINYSMRFIMVFCFTKLLNMSTVSFQPPVDG